METIAADFRILCGLAQMFSDERDAGSTGEAASSPTTQAAVRRPRVLVVDDQETIRELIAMYLEDERYEVQEAGSGPEALLRFMNGKWDLIITDRMMPEMTGDELATCIRRLDRKIPIILVSGFTGEGMGSFEFDAVVHKPFTKEALLEAIQGLAA